ncbi:cyclic nucleotide-binding domain-containing protein [Saccharopolyspora shandongensis]|uniref:cyclic nucleotide-binding domain-containing protein n=1 Tax=Saccharopolyspora shandongensis TaxID=418495 RepID=UPI003416B4CF
MARASACRRDGDPAGALGRAARRARGIVTVEPGRCHRAGEVPAHRELARGELLFQAGSAPPSGRILRQGRVELSEGSGQRRSVVHVLQPGDVDGDVQLLLDMPLPYIAHALNVPRYGSWPSRISSSCSANDRRSCAAGCPA